MLAEMRRVIIFCGDVQTCARFYRETFELKTLGDDPSSDMWLELDAGGCRLAFHKAFGPDGPVDKPTGSATNPHKVVFYAQDVAKLREELVRRGAPMGEVQETDGLHLCDGVDPEGHRFQISNR